MLFFLSAALLTSGFVISVINISKLFIALKAELPCGFAAKIIDLLKHKIYKASKYFVSPIYEISLINKKFKLRGRININNKMGIIEIKIEEAKIKPQ